MSCPFLSLGAHLWTLTRLQLRKRVRCTAKAIHIFDKDCASLAVMYAPYLLWLLWLCISTWKCWKTVDETKLGIFSEELLSCPLATVTALSSPSPPIDFQLWMNFRCQLHLIPAEGPVLVAPLWLQTQKGAEGKGESCNQQQKPKVLSGTGENRTFVFLTVKINPCVFLSFAFFWMINSLANQC